MIIQRRRRTPRAAFNGVRSQKWLFASLPTITRHLPEDLLLEILCRLPVKSLLRFRCVSKTWLALVDDDADFARLHLDTFKNNRDQARLFFFDDEREIYVVRSFDTYESISEIPCVENDQENDFLASSDIVSVVDGLALLRLNNALKLWNPSIRKFYQVPPAPKKSHIIGLGYDPLAKDYKIVVLIAGRCLFDPDKLPSIGIYTVGADSWRIIPFQRSDENLYPKSAVYFLDWDDDDSEMYLWLFDLSKEVFSRVSIPGDIDEFGDPFRLYFFWIGGGPSLAFYNDVINAIWVLEKETMTWKKRCLWSNRRTRLLYCKKNGDMLTIRTPARWSSRGEVGSYCHEKDEFKILQRNTRCPPYDKTMYVSSYVESLVLNKFLSTKN